MQSLIEKLNRLEIKIRVNGDKLGINSPKGVLTEDILSEIKERKQELIAYFGSLSTSDIQKCSSQKDYPLSSSQNRLWILSNYDGGTAAYNMLSVHEIKGALNVSSLNSAFYSLINRHESLRTIFRKNASGDVRQRIIPTDEILFKLAVNTVVQEDKAGIQEIIQQNFEYNFDLSSDSLIRAELLEVSPNHHILICVLHHIISDGWSSDIITSELFQLYDSINRNQADPLSELSIQYKDYAVWQQDKLREGGFNDQKGYWVKQLEGEISNIDLAINERPKIKTFNGRKIDAKLSYEETQSFYKLCKQYNCTPLMGLITALDILFFKKTNTNDILIGTAVSGRENVQLQNLVGFFVNSVAIRTQFQADHTFTDILKKNQNIILEAYENQLYPFDELIKEISVNWDLSRNPLFDFFVTFDSEDAKLKNYQLENLEISTYPSKENVSSKFDMEFVFKEGQDGLGITIIYNTDLYSDTFVEAFLEHYQILIGEILSHPDSSVKTLQYISLQEREKVIETFNSQTLSLGHATVLDLFHAQVEKNPDAVAVFYEETALTYKELNQRANQLAFYLQDQHNLKKNDHVAIKMSRSSDFIVALLGVLKSGACYIPVDPSYPQERIQYILQNANVGLLIDQDFINKFNEISSDLSNENPSVGLSGDDPVYIIYTSGSTGNPKGILMPHRSMLNLVTCHINQISHSQKTMQFTSIGFDVSFQEIFTTLVTGATLYPISNDIKTDPSELISFISTHHIDTIFLPTAYFKILGELSQWQQFLSSSSSLKHIIVAGEQLILSESHINTLKSSRVQLHNHYGPAETHVATMIALQDEDLSSVPSIGKPITNTQLYILDEYLEPVGIGITGQIYIAGDLLAKGYYNNEELTSEKFISNPFIMGTRMYNTGDLGRWLSDGSIDFLGRSDHQVKIRGFRIEPGEVENTILQYSQNISGAVIQVRGGDSDKHLVAYYTSLTPDTIDKSDLLRFLEDKLPDYMVPSFLVELDAIPLTSNGKVDHRKLPSVGHQDLLGQDYTAPSTPIENTLVDIWQSVLKLDRIGIHDNFFKIGGNSLIMAQLIGRMEKQLGKTITFKDFFSSPTISQINALLSDTPKASPLHRAPDGESYLATPSQRRLWVLSQMEGSSRAYNIPYIVKFTGALSPERLKTSFHSLLQRHEILRTGFKLDSEGNLSQYIFSTPQEEDFPWDYYENILQEDIQTIIEKNVNHHFDLAVPCLFKAALIKESEESYLFVLTLHHIIADGWSLNILIKDLVAAYNRFSENQEAGLPELDFQYKDYAYSLNQRIASGMSDARTFWLNHLSGELPVLHLPSFRKRPYLQTFNGNDSTHTFGSEFTSKLEMFSQSQNVSLFMLLMAGVKTLLHRYSGQNDIIVGTPIAGRDHSDLENQIGLYLNTLAIRTKFENESSFSSLLAQEKDTLLKAYEYQNYPFDHLVDQLSIKRDLSRSALFDVLLIFQNQQQVKSIQSDVSLSGDVQVEHLPVDNPTAQFDLTFSFILKDEGLSLNINYNTDIYDTLFINSIFCHFKNLLTEAIQVPGIPVGQIGYLSQEEETQILETFNNTAKSYPDHETVFHLFSEQVEKAPDSPAVIYQNHILTYKELDEQSNHFAYHILKTVAVNPDDLIAVKLERSHKLMITLLAVMKSGAAYVPVDPTYPEERISTIVGDSGAILTIDDVFWKEYENSVSENQISVSVIENTISPDQLAYVIYTSGTTGKPKGVMIEHGNLVNFLYGMNDVLSLHKEDENNLLAITSVSFDISILELFWTLINGVVVTIKGNDTSLNDFDDFLSPQSQKLDFSLFYFSSVQDSHEDKYNFIKNSVMYADENHFSAVWFPERHFHEFGGIFPNPSVLAAAFSTNTKNIQLRSGSVVLPLHDTIRVAEEWAVIDNLTNGRVALSIASGWHADDFVLKPENYKERQKIMYNQIAELRKLWKGESVKRLNGNQQEVDIKIFPKPQNENLELYITSGGSQETFRSAGQIGAHILTHLLGQELEELQENIQVYKQALSENGYDTDKAKIALMLHTYIGTDVEQVKSKVKTPFKDYLRSSVGLLEKLFRGFDKNITQISDQDFDDLLEIAFERYWNTSALFGTVDSCDQLIKKIYSIGVTEIACLADFGLENQEVLEGLQHLTKLKDKYKGDPQENRVTTYPNLLQITPSYLNILLEDQTSQKFISSLKKIFVGGERFPEDLYEKISSVTKAEIYNMYGPTETTIWSTVKRQEANTKINIGKPIRNTKTYIFNEYGQLCPIGVAGELYIGGDGVARGYLKNEALTQERFVNINIDGANDRMYKTGDLARWLPDGEIEYIGRNDNQVKINGYRIELSEIESVLAHHPAVNKAVAVVHNQGNGNPILAAYYVSDEDIVDAEVRDFLLLKLPYYMIPTYFIRLDKIPLTPNGKIDRKQLPKPDADTRLHQIISPKTDVEKRIAKIWAETLTIEIEKIGTKDNFFDLGGNSLMMIKMLNLLNKEFNTSIPLIDIYRLPNITLIAEHVEKSTQTIHTQAEEKMHELFGTMEETLNIINHTNNEE